MNKPLTATEWAGGQWFIMGKRADATVDICNPDGDVAEGLPENEAEKLVDAHNAAIEAVARHLRER